MWIESAALYDWIVFGQANLKDLVHLNPELVHITSMLLTFHIRWIQIYILRQAHCIRPMAECDRRLYFCKDRVLDTIYVDELTIIDNNGSSYVY